MNYNEKVKHIHKFHQQKLNYNLSNCNAMTLKFVV